MSNLGQRLKSSRPFVQMFNCFSLYFQANGFNIQKLIAFNGIKRNLTKTKNVLIQSDNFKSFCFFKFAELVNLISNNSLTTL